MQFHSSFYISRFTTELLGISQESSQRLQHLNVHLWAGSATLQASISRQSQSIIPSLYPYRSTRQVVTCKPESSTAGPPTYCHKVRHGDMQHLPVRCSGQDECCSVCVVSAQDVSWHDVHVQIPIKSIHKSCSHWIVPITLIGSNWPSVYKK